MIGINSLPGILDLSNQGEKDVRVIQINISDWLSAYPPGVFSISYMRADGSGPFPATGVSVADGFLTWAVGKHATEIAGTGSAVIILTCDECEKRTPAIYTFVRRGHGATGPAPEPMADYLAEVLAAGAAAARDANETAQKLQEAMEILSNQKDWGSLT